MSFPDNNEKRLSMPRGKHGGLTAEDYDDFYEEDYDDEDDYTNEEYYRGGNDAQGEASALPKPDQGGEYVDELLAQLVPGLQQVLQILV